MKTPPIVISLPRDNPQLKDCMPGDILIIKGKTLPGEDGEDPDSEEEPGGESEIMFEVQGITKAKPVVVVKPRAAVAPMEYLKAKQTGKKAPTY